MCAFVERYWRVLPYRFLLYGETQRLPDRQMDRETDRRTETERQRVAHAAFIVLLRISLIVFVSFALILGE